MTSLTAGRTVGQVRNPRLRLTSRGRVVISIMITLVLVGLLGFAALLGASGAQAVGEQDSSINGATSFETVLVQSGDSLWAIAARVAPKADPRDVVYDISKLNQLQGSEVFAGQQLAIPLKYTEK